METQFVTTLPAKAGEHLGTRLTQWSTLCPKGRVPAKEELSLERLKSYVRAFPAQPAI